MPSSRRSCKMPDGVPSANTEAPSTTTASARRSQPSRCRRWRPSSWRPWRGSFRDDQRRNDRAPDHDPTIRLNHPCSLLRVIRFDDSKRTQATDCRNTAAIESHGLVPQTTVEPRGAMAGSSSPRHSAAPRCRQLAQHAPVARRGVAAVARDAARHGVRVGCPAVRQVGSQMSGRHRPNPRCPASARRSMPSTRRLPPVSITGTGTARASRSA